MKQDLDLTRDILVAVESYEPETHDLIHNVSVDSFDANRTHVAYQLELMIVGGFFINPERCYDSDPRQGSAIVKISISGLSPIGNDFLNATRDQDIWDKTKAAAQRGGSWTLEIVIELAKNYAREKLGLSG